LGTTAQVHYNVSRNGSDPTAPRVLVQYPQERRQICLLNKQLPVIDGRILTYLLCIIRNRLNQNGVHHTTFHSRMICRCEHLRATSLTANEMFHSKISADR